MKADKKQFKKNLRIAAVCVIYLGAIPAFAISILTKLSPLLPIGLFVLGFVLSIFGGNVEEERHTQEEWSKRDNESSTDFMSHKHQNNTDSNSIRTESQSMASSSICSSPTNPNNTCSNPAHSNLVGNIYHHQNDSFSSSSSTSDFSSSSSNDSFSSSSSMSNFSSGSSSSSFGSNDF